MVIETTNNTAAYIIRNGDNTNTLNLKPYGLQTPIEQLTQLVTTGQPIDGLDNWSKDNINILTLINIYRLFLSNLGPNLEQYFSEKTSTDIDTRSSIIDSLKKFGIKLEDNDNTFTFYQIREKVSELLKKGY